MIFNFLKQGNANNDALSAYNFSFKDVSGAEFSLNDYKDKVLVVVNVASRCGFTNQYKDLQMISDKYKGNTDIDKLIKQKFNYYEYLKMFSDNHYFNEI